MVVGAAMVMLLHAGNVTMLLVFRPYKSKKVTNTKKAYLTYHPKDTNRDDKFTAIFEILQIRPCMKKWSHRGSCHGLRLAPWEPQVNTGAVARAGWILRSALGHVNDRRLLGSLHPCMRCVRVWWVAKQNDHHLESGDRREAFGTHVRY